MRQRVVGHANLFRDEKGVIQVKYPRAVIEQARQRKALEERIESLENIISELVKKNGD